MAKTTTGKRGRPPLSAAEKKRRAELKAQQKSNSKQPRQARRARSKSEDVTVELPQQGWWQTLHANQARAVIMNPISQEFRLIDLERGTMTRIEEPTNTLDEPPEPLTLRGFESQPTVSVDGMNEAA